MKRTILTHSLCQTNKAIFQILQKKSWTSVLLCVFIFFQKVTQGVERSQVRGIGFDATCSLVVLDQSFQPVPVTQDGKRIISVYHKTKTKTNMFVLFCKMFRS